MIQILHITTHMGGGVGRALSNITSYSTLNNLHYSHKILTLENPERTQFLETCKENGVEVVSTSDIKTITDEMLKSDIVVLNWWHHPKMAKFLYDFPKVPIRFVLWSHVSGCSYPELPFEFMKVFHKAFFTTNYTFENSYWSEEQKEYSRKNAEIIYGAGDLESISRINFDQHAGFNIGYVGTLNYSKLNPEFVSFCASVDVPEVKFIMVGDIDNQYQIEQDAIKYDIYDKFQFIGYTNNVSKELARFDVFGYPLNPWHFGTTENALLEAMASALPVVALNQCAEKYLIEHMKTGLLAENQEHYTQLMRYLYENPNERKRIGENGRKFVLDKFSIKKTVEKMNSAYDSVMVMPKKIFEFGNIFGSKPYEWFLSCLGVDRELFKNSISDNIMSNKYNAGKIEYEISNCRHILKDKSKSSINHFARCFPNDNNIMYWKSLIEK